jgi:hypothetical protein
MWRVRAGSTLSDMVNLARARDAARGIALCLLNKSVEGTAAEAPYARFSTGCEPTQPQPIRTPAAELTSRLRDLSPSGYVTIPAGLRDRG